MNQVSFLPFKLDHEPLMQSWYKENHVKTWWHPTKENFQKKIENPNLNLFIINYNNKDIGFIQSYKALPTDDGWWPHEPAGTYGVDFFIGDKDYLGKNIGVMALTQFTNDLLHKEEVSRIIADPSPKNKPGIKCFIRSGFNPLRTIDTPDGRAVYMDKRKLPRLKTKRMNIFLPNPEEGCLVTDYYKKNDPKHFKPWNPELPENFHTNEFWAERMLICQKEFFTDASCRFFLQDNKTGRIIGHANYGNFERGCFHNCRLGYAIDEDYEGKGYMYEALTETLDYIFNILQFRRVEANYNPINERSGKILKRLDFDINGEAKNYLKIAGEWVDHILTSKINPDWRD